MSSQLPGDSERNSKKSSRSTIRVAFPNLQVGHYQILEQIGSGGMGAVFKVRDTRLNRLAAIKVIHRSSLDTGGAKRFQREMNISASLNHPHIIKIYHIGVENQIPYLVMEYIDGLPLNEYAKKKPSFKLLIAALEKVARAVDYAHQHKVVHRDLKPANILMRQDGEPVLMDFGLAKTSEVGDHSLTRTGEVMGTPQFMAPEQARGQKRQIDARTDVYALGGILYYFLSGKAPARGDTLLEVLNAVISEVPPRPHLQNAKIPLSLENIAMKALEKRKERRYSSAGAFGDDLKNFLKGRTTQADRFYRFQKGKYILAASLLIVVIGFAVCALLARRQSGPPLPAQINIETTIAQHYLRGKKSPELYQASAQFSMALDLLQHSLPATKPGYNLWQRKLADALLDTYYRYGQQQLAISPEEARIYFSRAQEILDKFGAGASKLTQAWQEKLHLALMRAYFDSGNYRMVYSLGMTQLQQQPESAWMLAMAAYYCDEKDALSRLAVLQRQLPQGSARYTAVLYYQGMIWFQRQVFSKARKYFHLALQQMKKKANNYTFRDSLYLHYCASILVELNYRLPLALVNNLGRYLQLLQTDSRNSRLYREVRSRYNLVLIESGVSSARTADLANEIITFMDRCIKERPQYADYYDLRARGYRYLKKYRQASHDFSQACELASGKFDSLVGKITLFEVYAEPEQYQDYDRQVLRHFGDIMKFSPDVFATEFAQLRQEYLRVKFSVSQGIVYSSENFARFYASLRAKSPGIRQLAMRTIMAMTPSSKVLAALQQQLQTEKTLQPVIHKLIEAIRQHVTELQQRDLLVKLSQAPAQGSISPVILQYFQDHTAFLQQIVADSAGRFACGDKANWLWMRFLAARILAYLPQLRFREQLFHDCLNGKNSNSSTRVLAACVLHEAGLSLFDKSMLCDYAQNSKDEFLLALVAQTLRPTNADSRRVLVNLLSRGTLRVKLLAAHSLCYGGLDKQIMLPLLQALVAGHSSVDPHLRALSVLVLWHPRLYKYYFEGHSDRVRSYLPLLIKALSDSEQLVQRAALSPLRYIEELKGKELQTVIQRLRRLLLSNASPLMRHLIIVALGNVGDVDILRRTILNPRCHLLERLAAAVGFAWSQRNRTQQQMQLLSNGIMKVLLHDPNKHIRGFLIYVLCRDFDNFMRLGSHMPKKLLRTIINSAVLKSLGSRELLLNFYAAIAATYLKKIPAPMVERINNVWKNGTQLHLRAAGLGASIYLAFIQGTPQLEVLHRWAKEQYSHDQEQGRIYCLAAIWGYIRVLKLDIQASNYVASQVKWDPQQIRQYELLQLQKYASNRDKRHKYIDCLQRIVELFALVRDKSAVQRQLEKYYQTMLAMLWKIDGARDKALQLADSACVQDNWSDSLLVTLWAKLMAALHKQNEASKKLEQLLAQMPPQQSAGVARALAEIYSQHLDYDRAGELFYRQYRIDPGNSQALIAIANFYCTIGQYQRAMVAFKEGELRFACNARINLGLARCYAHFRQKSKVKYHLYKACWWFYPHNQKQLQRYPRLKQYLIANGLEKEFQRYLRRRK